MSKDKKRPIEEIQPVAESIVESLRPYCDRIEIAGSIRRGVAMVGDIEIVAVPKTTVLQATLFDDIRPGSTNHLHEYLDQLVIDRKISKIRHNPYDPFSRWGEKYRKFYVATKRGEVFKVDLFMTAASTWGSIFTIRTGGEAFSRWIVTVRSLYGAMPNNMIQDNGQLWIGDRVGEGGPGKLARVFRATELIPVPTEQAFFDAIGCSFIPPVNRSGDRRAEWSKSLI